MDALKEERISGKEKRPLQNVGGIRQNRDAVETGKRATPPLEVIGSR
jgi:hypothetical protein